MRESLFPRSESLALMRSFKGDETATESSRARHGLLLAIAYGHVVPSGRNPMLRLCALLLIWPGCLVAAVPEPDPNADTLIIGRVYSVAGGKPATGLAFDASGRVIAVGDAPALREQLRSRDRGLREIVVDGTVLPGLIDAHGHLMGLGLSLMQADLIGTREPAEVYARLREKQRALPKGAWLIGRGWDQNDWPEAKFPTRKDLDAKFPHHPVWLERVDGHAGWANSRALALARIDRKTPDPAGGRILRDEHGEPTGILVDNAMGIIDARLPKPDKDVRKRALRLAFRAAIESGLTGVHDAGVALADLKLMRQLADNNELPLRVYALADGDSDAFANLCKRGPYRHGSGKLTMRGVKLYADGALGSRGAALLSDYADDLGNAGLLIESEENLAALITRVAGCGLQPAVHAIGDRANRLALNAFAALDPAARAKLRPRIEHAQVVALDDIPRFARLGVIASMQPTHATSDMPWAEKRVGSERLRGAYAWRRFLDGGARIALGSDFPVESVAPLLGIYAAVSRQDAKGEPDGGWLPEQRLTIEEALDGFTRGAAYAGFAENEIGTLENGKQADFIVLSTDPHSVRGRALLAIKVRGTWVGGKKVF